MRHDLHLGVSRIKGAATRGSQLVQHVRVARIKGDCRPGRDTKSLRRHRMIPDHPLREGTNGRIAGPLPCELARLNLEGVALKRHGPEALRSHRNQHWRWGKCYALGRCWGGEGSHEGC